MAKKNVPSVKWVQRPSKNFDEEVTTLRDFKDLPIKTLVTELPKVAEAFGMQPRELIERLAPMGGDVLENDCQCCGNDSW